MAEAYIPGLVEEAHPVSASGTITLRRPAMYVDRVLFLNGAATSISAQTGTLVTGTATSTVTNAFTFNGTAESPSKTIIGNSGLGTNSLVIVRYLPAGAVGVDQ